jgi:hypothetical protein
MNPLHSPWLNIYDLSIALLLTLSVVNEDNAFITFAVKAWACGIACHDAFRVANRISLNSEVWRTAARWYDCAGKSKVTLSTLIC